MKAAPVSAAAALVLVGACASAQTQAPGLWEHSFTIKSQNGEMEKAMADMHKQLASMPPEQRKAMEQMMAGRGAGVGPKGNTFKACVSKEEAARQTGPQLAEGNCTQQIVQRNAATMKVKWECTGREPSSGEGEVTFKSDKAYTGRSVVTSTVQGKPEKMTIEQAGQWVAADCGAIKPRAPARP